MPDAGLVIALGYVGLGVSDIEAWRAFAEDVLGTEVTSAPGGASVRIDERWMRIALEAGGPDDIAFAGWEVRDAAALEAVRARLEADGVAVREGSVGERERRGVAGLLLARDPSGVPLEFFHGMRTGEPFRSPRALDGFVTGAGGVGHIVLVVDDFARTMRFYRDVLGFRVSDYVDFEIVPGEPVTMGFLHCNPRHHSLAFMVRRGAPRRLSHLMLEVRAIDDLLQTVALIERREIPLLMSLGRHSNDQVLSVYAISPSGFPIEYGWGSYLIDDASWETARYSTPSIWGHERRVATAPAPHHIGVR